MCASMVAALCCKPPSTFGKMSTAIAPMGKMSSGCSDMSALLVARSSFKRASTIIAPSLWRVCSTSEIFSASSISSKCAPMTAARSSESPSSLPPKLTAISVDVFSEPSTTTRGESAALSSCTLILAAAMRLVLPATAGAMVAGVAPSASPPSCLLHQLPPSTQSILRFRNKTTRCIFVGAAGTPLRHASCSAATFSNSSAFSSSHLKTPNWMAKKVISAMVVDSTIALTSHITDVTCSFDAIVSTALVVAWWNASAQSCFSAIVPIAEQSKTLCRSFLKGRTISWSIAKAPSNDAALIACSISPIGESATTVAATLRSSTMLSHQKYFGL